MIKYLWPELRKRGVFWDDYEKVGGSMRESYWEMERVQSFARIIQVQLIDGRQMNETS